MRRVAILVAVATLGVAGVGVFACSSSDDASSDAPDGGDETTSSSSGTTSSSSGSSGASSGSSGASSGSSGSSGTDGGDAGDGGTDAKADGPTEGGSNPTKVSCGAMECSVDGGQYCCINQQNQNGVCQNNNQNCNGNGLRLRCDESLDCPANNNKCCLSLIQGQASCDNNCQGNEAVLCKTNAECGANGTCKEITCLGGRKFKSCNTPAGCQ